MQQILSHGRLCYTHLHPKLEKTMDLKTGMGQNPVHCTPLYPWLVDIKIAGFSEWSSHVVIPCHSKNGGIDPSGACHLKREHQACPPVLALSGGRLFGAAFDFDFALLPLRSRSSSIFTLGQSTRLVTESPRWTL